MALTTGNNTWAQGLDVVVEGTAVRVAENDELERLATAFEDKYGAAWHFDVGDGMFLHDVGGHAAAVFRIETAKVLAFAKDPHAQTHTACSPYNVKHNNIHGDDRLRRGRFRGAVASRGPGGL